MVRSATVVLVDEGRTDHAELVRGTSEARKFLSNLDSINSGIFRMPRSTFFSRLFIAFLDVAGHQIKIDSIPQDARLSLHIRLNFVRSIRGLNATFSSNPWIPGDVVRSIAVIYDVTVWSKNTGCRWNPIAAYCWCRNTDRCLVARDPGTIICNARGFINS